MRRLLQYCQSKLLFFFSTHFISIGQLIFFFLFKDPDGVWWEGAMWALGMAMVELFRVLFFGMTWGVAYR